LMLLPWVQMGMLPVKQAEYWRGQAGQQGGDVEEYVLYPVLCQLARLTSSHETL